MSESLYFLKGVNGQLEVFEDRVVITRKGYLGFMTQGLAGEKTIPIRAIQSVQFRPGGGFANGFIQFTVMGGRERQGGVFAATHDENTIIVREYENDVAECIRDYIEECILNGNTHSTQVQQISVADELKKFKELLDLGIISQEEFDEQKKKLLNSTPTNVPKKPSQSVPKSNRTVPGFTSGVMDIPKRKK